MSEEIEPRKMTIIPFDSVKFDNQRTDLKSFVAMYNPTTFTQKHAIEYNDGQVSGSSASEPKFMAIKPTDFSVELLIDGTGASPSSITNDKPKSDSTSSGGTTAAEEDGTDVQSQVDHFKKVCVEYYGAQHGPNYVKILWGKQLFKGALTTMDVAYTLFNKDGVPLRAKITASFVEAIDDTHRVNEEKSSSPDLTHERIVLEGDSLPLMSYRIYGDAKYYLQVAQVNGLNNYRKLIPGQVLFFPPINKA